MKQWIIKTLDLIPSDPKRSKTSYLSIDFRTRGAEKRAIPNHAFNQTILEEFENFLQHLPQKSVFGTERKCECNFSFPTSCER